MIRTLVIGLALLITGVVPAFAQKVTLACSLGRGYVTVYLTINADAKTVIDPSGGTYPAQITDDAVTWYAEKSPGPNVLNTYNRHSAQLRGWETNEYDPNTKTSSQGAAMSCVKAPAPPF